LKLLLLTAILLVVSLAIISIILNPHQLIEFQVNSRVNEALNVYPLSELIYSGYLSREVETAKLLIYWTNDPFNEVHRHTFFTDYQLPSCFEWENGYEGNCYIVTSLSQATLDAILRFEHDLCCYGADPHNLSLVRLHVIAADSEVIEDDSVDVPIAYSTWTIDFADLLTELPTSGTFILIGYRTTY